MKIELECRFVHFFLSITGELLQLDMWHFEDYKHFYWFCTSIVLFILHTANVFCWIYLYETGFRPSIYSSICLSVCPSIYLYISVYAFVRLSIHLSIFLSIYLSIFPLSAPEKFSLERHYNFDPRHDAGRFECVDIVVYLNERYQPQYFPVCYFLLNTNSHENMFVQSSCQVVVVVVVVVYLTTLFQHLRLYSVDF
jgi:hypothetical protein